VTTETLQAGRELDALVAEKVMGYKWDGVRDDLGETRILYVPGTNWCAVDCTDAEPPRYTDILPKFSTDIAAAWAVVEAMERRGWNVTVQRTWEGYRCEMDDMRATHAAVVDPRDGHGPLAICRAALAALEDES
jgi:G:T-mismatch repair DNA endonuclease (very short patch repair protein)